MRPKSIQLFERLYLASIALYVIATVVDWNIVVTAANAVPGVGGAGAVITGGVLAGVVLARLAIWYFVAKTGSVVARWLAVALFLLNLWGIADTIMLVGQGRTGAAVSLGSLIVELAAIIMLFRADAKPWFEYDEDEDGEIVK